MPLLAKVFSSRTSASVPFSKFRHDRSVSGTRTYPTCPKCGKNHPGECFARKEGCFGCGQTGHRLRDCPSSKKGQGGNNGRAQSTTSAAPAGRPTQQGNSSGATLSFVTYITVNINVSPETLSEPFSVSTLVGDPIIAKRVYINCHVTVSQKITSVDLVKLEMVDFDIILGMDWLHSCYASVDCRTRIIRFQFPDEPILEWKGSSLAPMGRFISYLKARKMISKGYLYHLVWVKDLSSETLTLESVPVVNEFLEVFLEDLPGVLIHSNYTSLKKYKRSLSSKEPNL
ncbi:hypothetical protein MTR67_038885 [Solanum verrucosum]|uniref:CCHC-type domain-containing protein n=1 Tax=Solanum verrucosum TaxID=315347 RepID=A0AAF0ZQ43_SOLVR|nr:hypothetical protein MTR67_038885 [Solanum verrucosum]